jgi:hypothetical protein
LLFIKYLFAGYDSGGKVSCSLQNWPAFLNTRMEMIKRYGGESSARED